MDKNEEQVKREIQSLLSTNNTSLVGEIGEIVARRYLLRTMKFVYLYPPFIRKGDLKEWIKEKVRDEEKSKYLMDYKGRSWDFIGVRHRYESRYGRKRIEEVAFELRRAHSEKDKQNIKTKEEELNHLLRKFRIEDVYLIEIKTVRKGAIRHDFTPIPKHKIGDVQQAKAHGFKVLLVIVTLLSNWKFECKQIEL